MKISELIEHWEEDAAGELTQATYQVRLPLEDAAKIEALAEMFPRRAREQIITDLLSASLDQLVSTLPYVEGNRIVTRDEEGDPVYEDAGLTPRYLELTHRHAERLARENRTGGDDTGDPRP